MVWVKVTNKDTSQDTYVNLDTVHTIINNSSGGCTLYFTGKGLGGDYNMSIKETAEMLIHNPLIPRKTLNE